MAVPPALRRKYRPVTFWGWEIGEVHQKNYKNPARNKRKFKQKKNNRDNRASSRLPLGRCDSARAGGGALPVIMSIIRSSRNLNHDYEYRNYNL